MLKYDQILRRSGCLPLQHIVDIGYMQASVVRD